MPPKKSRKSRKGGKGGDGGGGRKKGAKNKEVNKLSELDKEVFLIQIKDLEEKVQRYSESFVSLEANCAEYKAECEKVTVDKFDTVEYLKHVLEIRNGELEEVQKRLANIESARGVDEAAHEKLVVHLKAQYHETQDRLTSEIIVLDGKLASLEEFKAQKDKMLAQLEELQERLKVREAEHVEAMRLAEKSAILEKDRLKREMVVRLEDVAAKFREVSSQQMAETTRRAIDENAALGAHIDRLKGKMATVMEDNQRLMEARAKHLLRIGVLESVEADLLKRITLLGNTVHELQSKADANVHDKMHIERLQSHNRKLEDDVSRLQAELSTFKEEVNRKRESNVTLTDNVGAIAKKLENVQLDHTLIGAVLRNAASALHDGIKAHGEIGSNRDGTLENLLDILNAANEKQQPQQPDFTGTVSNRRQSSDEEYLLGDIGIVPRYSSVSIRTKGQVDTRTDATQTEIVGGWQSAAPSPLPPVIDARRRRSIAYRILKDIGHPAASFHEKPTDLMPQCRVLPSRRRTSTHD